MFRVAVCTLNQFALDFAGNLDRIVRSIQESKRRGAILRVGPELEIPGYSLDDAFFEKDTEYHSWQVVEQILTHKDLNDIIIDVGMGVIKDGCLFNCRLYLLNQKVIHIRPKIKLAGNGNYREDRWFTAWESEEITWFQLPANITKITGQSEVPFGSDIILDVHSAESSASLRVGTEICEELWRTDSTHVDLFLKRGVHLVLNSSASYWEIRKLDTVFSFTQALTLKSGGAYALTNLLGCDGSRLCFYGMSSVALNGKLVAMTACKDDVFEEVQVACSDISIDDIESYRRLNYLKVKPFLGVGDIVFFDSKKGHTNIPTSLKSLKNLTIEVVNFHPMASSHSLPPFVCSRPSCPEEEILWYGSLWLWDYLRRSPPLRGFMLPLSGGIDSSSVACLVYGMSHFLAIHIKKLESRGEVTPRIRQLLSKEGGNEASHERLSHLSASKITHRLLKCAYLGTKYSGGESLCRAQSLSHLIGAKFINHCINPVYELMLKDAPVKLTPGVVSLGEQNLQARLRMVHTYFLANNRLVLSTGNVDEALVGYLTKYDCSSGDINPIGSISKRDLRSFMTFFEKTFFKEGSIVSKIVAAPPSAELTGADQEDEIDLGLTYDEMSLFGRFRKGVNGSYGPFYLFKRVWERREDFQREMKDMDPETLARKVKRFFTLHARNRHKQTILTPSLHSESYSPDDNRFDHRQIIFQTNWTWQFREIDNEVKKILAEQK